MIPTTALPRDHARRKWLLMLTIALLVVALDQYSKRWAQAVLFEQQSRSLSLLHSGSFSASLTFVRNRGAAWGLLSRSSSAFRRPFLVTVSIIAMGLLLHLLHRLRSGQRLLIVALALVMGGAVGNFIDRLRFDYVIDFIDLRLGTFRWPTFNVADVAISVGVGLILIETLFDLFGSAGSDRAPREPTDVSE